MLNNGIIRGNKIHANRFKRKDYRKRQINMFLLTLEKAFIRRIIMAL